MSDPKDLSEMRAWLASRRSGTGLASAAAKGGGRILQTLSVLARTGTGWLMGNRPPTPALLRQIFEELGTTYIKLGQFIASSPSVFPEEYVNEFQKCLDKTPVLPFNRIRQTVEFELGKPLEAIFAYVDPQPLASASIAQVHAARLLTGEDVVIKVQKPGVRDVLLTDFNFIYLAARVFEWLSPGLTHSAISGVIDEIQASMLEECDFLQEADNLEKFNEFLSMTGNVRAVAPKPYREHSSRKVLTMERFYGVPLTDLQVLKQYVEDPADVLIAALNTWFSSLMMCDFFHADVHAGNLMLLEDGRIGFIDFGIVGRIKRDTWDAMANFFDAIARGDYRKMAESMLKVGMTREQVDVDQLTRDIERFQSGLMEFDPSAILEGRPADNEVNQLMMDLIHIGEHHGIRFPREFALLVKQFLYFDRYVQALAPEMNMFADQRVDIWGAGGDPADELMELLESIEASPDAPKRLH